MALSVGDYVLAHYRGQGIVRLCQIQHVLSDGRYLATADKWTGNCQMTDAAVKHIFGQTRPTKRQIYEARKGNPNEKMPS